MTDDLRTRIVSALQLASDRQTGWRGILDCVDLADAVIRELGLRQEWAVADSDGDFVYVGSIKEKADCYTVQPGDHKQTRYVTDWETE